MTMDAPKRTRSCRRDQPTGTTSQSRGSRQICRDCSTVTGANPRIARREQEESTSDPLKDDELAPNSANGSIPSLIAWTELKPPGNAATVSLDFGHYGPQRG